MNAVVSYNLKAIRERHGWTQQGVADRLGQLTGHILPQASISAMERASTATAAAASTLTSSTCSRSLFEVPIAYFFVPPPGSSAPELADTGRPVPELYAAVLGREWQLALPRRAAGRDRPQEPRGSRPGPGGPLWAQARDRGLARPLPHLAQKRLRQVERQYGDQLDEVAEFLADFAAQIKAAGPKTYLESMAHRKGEAIHNAPTEPED